MKLKAPFPWFGGKSRAASLVWQAFGHDIPNYVEPFAGSLAVLLGRDASQMTRERIETVNDLDCYLANFWRAVQGNPEGVARHADWPVNEADLHARHRWLVKQEKFRQKMHREPDYYDVKIAGWWLWGVCMWIGGGWCAESNWNGEAPRERGNQTAEEARRPHLMGANGVHRRQIDTEKLPAIGGRIRRGVTAAPSLEPIFAWMLSLQERLRRTRVCCGDWSRVLGRSVTELIGVTGIFFDPPYLVEAGRDASLYAVEGATVANDVREWCIENGDNRMLRIALCGYEGEHEMPDSWQCVSWKAVGGYAAAAGNTENAHRERIWFSPACLRVDAPEQLGMNFEVASG